MEGTPRDIVKSPKSRVNLLVRWAGNVAMKPGFGPYSKEITSWMIFTGHSISHSLSTSKLKRFLPFAEKPNGNIWQLFPQDSSSKIDSL